MKEIDAAVATDEITDAMEKETDLPSVVNKGLQSNEDFYKMAFQFQEIMMIYESAIKQLETKLEILNKEYKVTGRRNPIDNYKIQDKITGQHCKETWKEGTFCKF